jgi:phenol phosphorylase subunit beta
MNTEKANVIWFEECNKDSVDFVGGKNSSLGELIKAGLRVPPGFAVTTTGYRNFMDHSGIEQNIFELLKDVSHEDIETLESLSKEIRQLIEETPFSIELEDDIAEMYRLLSQRCFLPATPVAVRSSATAEDLPDASFAGQQDTYLWIRGVDDVLHNVRRCFSSLYTGRAIAYREKMGYSHEEVNISVGIQKMANSHTAGVMFTLNPSTGDRSIIAINASYGFGESIVSGEVTPDEFLVNKITLDTIKRTIATKTVYYAVDHEEHRARLFDVPVERQNIQSIVDEDVSALAAMGKQIEKHYGKPMDIEWAVDSDMPADSNVFILQARPETVWSRKQAIPVSNGKKYTATDHILAGIMAGKQLK